MNSKTFQGLVSILLLLFLIWILIQYSVAVAVAAAVVYSDDIGHKRLQCTFQSILWSFLVNFNRFVSYCCCIVFHVTQILQHSYGVFACVGGGGRGIIYAQQPSFFLLNLSNRKNF